MRVRRPRRARAGAQVAAPGEKSEAAQPGKAKDTKVVKKATTPKAGIKTSAKETTETKKAGSPLGFIIVLIIILLGAAAVGFCIILMKKQADKRRKFLEDLDKGVI